VKGVGTTGSVLPVEGEVAEDVDGRYKIKMNAKPNLFYIELQTISTDLTGMFATPKMEGTS